MLVLAVGSAVNAQQQRHLASFHVTERVSQQSVHFSSVFALETDFLGRGDVQLGHQGVVLMSELTQSIAFHRVNFRRFCVVPGKQNRVPAAII